MNWTIVAGGVVGAGVVAAILAVAARTPSSRRSGWSGEGGDFFNNYDSGDGGHCHGADVGGGDCGGGDGGGH